jgi:hypothetical protein
MTTTAAARRQIEAILADGRPRSWCEIQRIVALTHAIPQKSVSSLLRDLVATGEVVRDNPGDREPTVRLQGSGES